MVPMAVTRGAPGYDEESESDDDYDCDHDDHDDNVNDDLIIL